MKNETRLISRLQAPWAIRPESLNAYLAMEDDDMPTGEPRKYEVAVQGGVAVVPLYGVMMKNPDFLDRIMGACDVEEFARAVQAASVDPSASAILIDCDSPGGEIRGVDEAAEAVSAASKIKPVIAYTGGSMASAAYWVCSQADLVYASRASLVGSIGVYAVARDYSKAYEAAGIKSFLIKSGDAKGQGVPGLPVSDDTLADMQGRVDAYAGMFKAAVNNRRKVADAHMQGQVFMADEAMGAGIIDAITNFNKALADAGTLAGVRLAAG